MVDLQTHLDKDIDIIIKQTNTQTREWNTVLLFGFVTYSCSIAQHCSSVSFSQCDNLAISLPALGDTRIVFSSSQFPRVNATAAHTAPTSNIFTSSLQSGSIRSAGFSPLSFSASTLAPIDSRYLG